MHHQSSSRRLKSLQKCKQQFHFNSAGEWVKFNKGLKISIVLPLRGLASEQQKLGVSSPPGCGFPHTSVSRFRTRCSDWHWSDALSMLALLWDTAFFTFSLFPGGRKRFGGCKALIASNNMLRLDLLYPLCEIVSCVFMQVTTSHRPFDRGCHMTLPLPEDSHAHHLHSFLLVVLWRLDTPRAVIFSK